MLRIAQARVTPVPAVEQRPRPAVLMMDIGIKEKAQHIIRAGVDRQHAFTEQLQGQASAAVMDVTPVPRARPVIPE